MSSSPAGADNQYIELGDLLGFEVFYEGRAYKNTAVAMEDAELAI